MLLTGCVGSVGQSDEAALCWTVPPRWYLPGTPLGTVVAAEQSMVERLGFLICLCGGHKMVFIHHTCALGLGRRREALACLGTAESSAVSLLMW